jgi:hypothetical protein
MTVGASQKVEFASLDAAQLKTVRQLEKKLGAFVVAYKTPLRPAPLTDEQLAALRKTEEAMPGVCLVAYETPKQP